jgi:hypothetical protein
MNPRAPAGVSLSALRSTSPLGASTPRAGKENQRPGSWSSFAAGFAASFAGVGADTRGATFAGAGDDGAGAGITQAEREAKREAMNSSAAATNLVDGLTPSFYSATSPGCVERWTGKRESAASE